jgi:hypothetical protein
LEIAPYEGKGNRVEQFEVITTMLDVSIDGKQIGGLYEHRWEGEVYQPECVSSAHLYQLAA